MKSLQPGESIPVILVVRQLGSIGNLFLGFGNLKASELLRAESQTHRLVSVGPRRTQGSHHLNSAIHQFPEVQTMALVVSPQIGRRDKSISQTGHKNVEPVTSNGNFEQ